VVFNRAAERRLRWVGSRIVLRPGLLEDTVVLAAPDPGAASACAALGAEVVLLGAPALDEEAMAAAVRPDARAIVVAGAGLLGEGLTFALDATWCAVRAAATAAFIPGGGGKVILVAPRDGRHAVALRAGYENLARTSSIEWAQYGITPTAILPGTQTTDGEVADLVAYLVSPAGDYFAGCSFDLQ
jgi:hypothetical protein